MDNLLIAEKLDEARKLIERGWCQGEYAFYAGEAIADDADITVDCDCYCAIGALRAVCGDNFTAAHHYLARAVGDSQTLDWNDAPERTQAEVIEAFRKASQLSRNRGGCGMKKLLSTICMMTRLGMARTFGRYHHSVGGPDIAPYAVYEWRGKTWHIPTGAAPAQTPSGDPR
jgi:hypothetical protein